MRLYGSELPGHAGLNLNNQLFSNDEIASRPSAASRRVSTKGNPPQRVPWCGQSYAVTFRRSHPITPSAEPKSKMAGGTGMAVTLRAPQ
jgi:hypothetical protein